MILESIQCVPEQISIRHNHMSTLVDVNNKRDYGTDIANLTNMMIMVFIIHARYSQLTLVFFYKY